tara:strand:- start:470 stop:1273 length:804 start_codon:yes stop_codon:yes gene_type:complete
MTLVLLSSFLKWTKYEGGLNLWQINLWFALIIFAVILSLVFWMYLKKFEGNLFVGIFFVILTVLSLIFNSESIHLTSSFMRYVLTALGFSVTLRGDGFTLFSISSFVIILLSISLYVIHILGWRKAGEVISKKIIYSIIVSILVLLIVFGTLFIHYSMVRIRSNNAVISFLECSKECPIEEYISEYDSENLTDWKLENYCFQNCSNYYIQPLAETVYPDAFWEVSPLGCPWVSNAKRYSECVDHILDEWDKGIVVDREVIKEYHEVI